MPQFIIEPDTSELVNREQSLTQRMQEWEERIEHCLNTRNTLHNDYQAIKETLENANDTGNPTFEEWKTLYPALLILGCRNETMSQFKADPLSAMRHHGQNRIDQYKTMILDNARDRRHQQSRLDRSTVDRATVQQSLALSQMQNTKIIDIDVDQLHASLSRHPLVTHIKSWETYELDAPLNIDLHLRLHLTPISMEPSANCEDCDTDNEADRCNAYGIMEMPSSALSFTWNMNELKPALVHLTGTRFEGYDRASLVHPHWIQRDVPCLGDFGDAIGAAIAEGQIYSMIIIYLEYLQQYNQCDPAGKLANRWNLNPCNIRIKSQDYIKAPKQEPRVRDNVEIKNFKLTANPITSFIGPPRKKDTDYATA